MSVSHIYKLEEDGTPQIVASYSLQRKEALICFIEQTLLGNYNTVAYPEEIDGMRSTAAGNWYYSAGGTNYASYNKKG